MEERVRREKELNETQIAMMQSQLNPHFLYNTLDTMKWVAKANHIPEIATLAAKLAKILRTSISSAQFITLQEEMTLVESYAKIQKIRFNGKFDFRYEIAPETEEILVPKLIVQPIVENAVIHGIENIENEGVIRIVLKKMGTDLLVTVQDNGAGFDVKEYFNSLEQAENGSSREKIGLKNVDLRLRHIYGEEYRIKIKSKINTGTTIYIKIPIEEREENV